MEINSSPHFNLKPDSFGTDLLQEFLVEASQKNKELVENTNPLSGFFKRDKISIFIFNLSEQLKLNNEGKFLALELFDRFMSFHLREIYDLIKKNTIEENNFKLIKKIKNQMILRSLSCIQIANKLSSNKSIIKCLDIKDILQEMGYLYSVDSILKSELRVLKTLNFKLNILTPYVMIELLLEILGHNLPQIDPKPFYLICIRLLESFYCNREKIYDRLFESFTGRTRDNSEREKFLSIENDHLYLASSIIVASVHIMNRNDSKTQNLVLNSINTITKLDESDLNEFCLIILNFSLNENE